MKRIGLIFSAVSFFLFLSYTLSASDDYAKYLPKLIELLKKGDIREKELALRSLWFLKYPEYRKDNKVFDPILEALKDKNSSVREAAASFLKEMGESSQGCCKETNIIPALTSALLSDEKASVRAEAAKALGYYNDKRSMDALISGLHDSDAWVRLYTVYSLGQIGQKMWSVRLEPKLPPGVKQAGKRVSRNGSLPPAEEYPVEVSSAVPHAKSKQAFRVRDQRWYEYNVDTAVDAMISLLSDESEWRNVFLQQECIIALRKMYPFKRNINQLLLNKYRFDYLKVEVIHGLGTFGAVEAKGLLVDASRGPDNNVRRAALESLVELPLDWGKMNRHDREQYYALFATNVSDAAVRPRAISGLGKLKDARAIPLLVKFLQDSSDEVRLESIGALSAFNDDKLLDAFASVFGDSSKNVRDDASAAFVRLAARTSRGGLNTDGQERMGDKGATGVVLESTAAESLFVTGINHPHAVRVLKRTMEGNDWAAKDTARRILWKFEDKSLEKYWRERR